MHILVGLGNPGREYRGHRHNIGFMVMEAIAKEYRFGVAQKKFSADISQGRINNAKVMLVKPQTFMNKSGHSVRQILDFYKLNADSVTVFYDELDLVPGKMRIKRGGSSGGHNGIKSLDANIGPNYRRVRLGIGHPGHKDQVARYVLHDFNTADKAWLNTLLPVLASELSILLGGNDAKYCSRVMQSQVSDKTRSSSTTLQSEQAQPSKNISPGPSTHWQKVKQQSSTALGAAFSKLLGYKNN